MCIFFFLMKEKPFKVINIKHKRIFFSDDVKAFLNNTFHCRFSITARILTTDRHARQKLNQVESANDEDMEIETIYLYAYEHTRVETRLGRDVVYLFYYFFFHIMFSPEIFSSDSADPDFHIISIRRSTHKECVSYGIA